MADDNNGGGGGFDLGSTTSFSQLLFSEDDAVFGFDHIGGQSLFSSFCGNNDKPPKMLCFGDCGQDEGGEVVLFGNDATNNYKNNYNGKNISTPLQKYPSSVTCSDSSSASSGNSQTFTKSNKKQNGKESAQGLSCFMAANATQRTSKKTKTEQNPSSTGHAKVRKEKLGERITALQQLVSPFGKTDTASVLHEAMGYIRFLHDQVQVLCSPYLQHHIRQQDGGENGGEEGSRKDLRSRGLCLVPVACTVHVANNNGADFWSPAMGHPHTAAVSSSVSSLTTRH